MSTHNQDSQTLWRYGNELRRPDRADVVGYDVHATDGDIGKVVEETTDVDAEWLVVDTGFWILGKKRLVPAGLVNRIDHDDKTIHVDATKDQIKESPDYESELGAEDRVVDHDRYGEIYSGWLRM